MHKYNAVMCTLRQVGMLPVCAWELLAGGRDGVVLHVRVPADPELGFAAERPLFGGGGSSSIGCCYYCCALFEVEGCCCKKRCLRQTRGAASTRCSHLGNVLCLVAKLPVLVSWVMLSD